MALSDPQSITVGGTTFSLARVETAGRRSSYSDNTDTIELTVSHITTKAGRKSHQVSVRQNAVVTDPITSDNDEENMEFVVTMKRPARGFSVSQFQALGAAVVAWMSSANLAKIFGEES